MNLISQRLAVAMQIGAFAAVFQLLVSALAGTAATAGDLRKLRIVAREDTSLGEMLVREGLARPWGGVNPGWCP